MTTTTDTRRDAKPQTGNRTERLSPDGKWCSFSKVPNLLQYVSTGLYFARVKVQGKPIRRGLDTDVFTTAKLKLADIIKKQHEPKANIGTFGAALKIYIRSFQNAQAISDDTKRHRLIASEHF